VPLGTRFSLVAGAIAGKIYAVGGYNIATSAYLNRNESFDPATKHLDN